MSKKWKLTERTRTLLTLELAIVLPAAALMGFSIWNLKHIQRDKAIEAAIQRDFSYVLKIAEKKSWKKPMMPSCPIRKEFPNPEDGSKIKSKLDDLLIAHPEFAYAIYFDKKTNMLVSSIQPNHNNDPEQCERADAAIKIVSAWFPMEAADMAAHIRMLKEKDESPVSFYDGWSDRDNQHMYWNVAYFIPPDIPKDRVTLGAVGFDEDYLREHFFPGVLKAVLNSKSAMLRADQNPPALMIHPRKDSTPWVATENWGWRQAGN